MKKCKVLHINDGNPRVIRNHDRLMTEDFPAAEEVLSDYINQGYEVKLMIPHVSPANFNGSGYPFYRTGFVVYLEKDL